jgi:cytochrome c peroxidase
VRIAAAAFKTTDVDPPMMTKIRFCQAAGMLMMMASFPVTAAETVAVSESDAIVELGRALFFDTNLSANRTQACASCHQPGRAFSDGRDSGVSAAVSLGDDGVSLGDRNAPTLTYAALIPEFHQDQNHDYVGGFFQDGRAQTMLEQAREPFLNPIEMAMPDSAAVIARVRENHVYAESLRQNFGDDVFANDERAFAAIASSIVAFERTEMFASFDSKYDRFLRGEYELTPEEEFGRLLFFSQLINCSSCHLTDEREFGLRETFTNNLYHNIGVPANAAVRQKNGSEKNYRDTGLLLNPRVDDPAQAGKFRVPSLRNVAVTPPYMHNGVFQDLETVIHFYNKFIVTNEQTMTNPETGTRWQDAEVDENLAFDLLHEGQPLSDDRVTAVAAFLRTLTDRRYEAPLE